MAIAPSCGQQMCTPANCDGCCKANVCVAKPLNSNNTTCGTSGNMCQDCAATSTTCDSTTFTCGTGGTGGGAGGGGTAGGTAGGGVTCDGCRLANGTCQPRGTTRQNNNICGANGETCKACAAPTPACDNGTCIAPPKKVGDSCLGDADCQATLGPAAICKQQNLSGSITYAGGMCTIPRCSAANDCPMGSICLNFPRVFGEEVSACFVSSCGAMAPCRAGFGCFNIGQGATACLPSELSNDELELDTVSILHEPCTTASDCRAPVPGAPFAGGGCFAEVLRRADGGVILGRDGGPQYTGNPGGQCTRDCRDDLDCSETGEEDLRQGVCLGISQTQAACFKACPAPNQGQSTCRTGYICEQRVLNFPDGGREFGATGYCDNRCDVLGAGCGNFPDGGRRQCQSDGYCQTDRFYNDGGVDAGTTDDGGVDAGVGGGAAGGGAAGGG
ncbi:MAG: hypothetical protein Q8S33_35115, partial [Myxococcales bacterium]|nr:hypothetical protein [Myxococcales bacterium]